MRSNYKLALQVCWKICKYFAFFVLLLTVGIAVFLGYSWYESQDPQGESNSYCTSVEMPPVPNESGMVVTAHNTVCDVFGGNSAIYVHVHKVGQGESKKSLVFRYADKYDVPPPKFEWSSNDSLRISVGNVSQVTKQLYLIDGVKITYVIWKEDYPRP